MTFRASVSILALISMLGAAGVSAQTPAKSDPRADIASKIPGTRADQLKQSPIPGMYELVQGTDFAYVSADGKYAIAGDLYDIGSSNNLTEERRRDARIKLVSDMPEAQMLIFGPKSPKYTITVFTDIDCSYCRRLHSQIAEYNRLGIRVRYMFFPRSGPDTESWAKAEEVWCAPDRNDALTHAKLGEKVKNPKTCATPIERHYSLGLKLGVQGTPAIVLGDGELLPGFVPPSALVNHLRTTKQASVDKVAQGR